MASSHGQGNDRVLVTAKRVSKDDIVAGAELNRRVVQKASWKAETGTSVR